MSDYIQGCNDGLIIGMTMGLQIIVNKGGIGLPNGSSLLLDLGFMSSWDMQPTPELIPMPSGLLLDPIPSDGSWI